MGQVPDPQLEQLPLITLAAAEGTGYHGECRPVWFGMRVFDLRFFNPHRYYLNSRLDSFLLSNIPQNDLLPMLTRMLIEAQAVWRREKSFVGRIYNKLTASHPGYIFIFGDVFLQVLKAAGETFEKKINPKAHYAVRFDKTQQLKAKLERLKKDATE